MLEQPEVTVGVVGHVDHGKTTLVQALTGIWTMRHSMEVKEARTIFLGYADGEVWECPGCGYPERFSPEPVCDCKPGEKPRLVRRLSFIDAPGHETLMAVMLSGIALMDGALLVVAANEPCPQPQTREHLAALEITGIKNIIVVQNKVDVVSKERALKSYEEIKRFVKGTAAENAPVIPVSALKRVNVDAVLAAIQKYIPTPPRDLDKPPLMHVVRSFDVNKPGTAPENLVGGVLGGALVQGALKVGDEIEIRPGIEVRRVGAKREYEPIFTRVEGLRFGERDVKVAVPGGLVAVATSLDPSLTKANAMVGNVVGKPGQLPPVVDSLTMKYQFFERIVGLKEEVKAEPLKKGEQIYMTIGPSNVLGIVEGVKKDIVDVRLDKQVVVWKGARIAISRRVMGRWRLIGWGTAEL
ncbi:MAG: translation initiation factor IF-2 subunit gamma [Acidilobaceae archaeon]|nr:translation initiation factor IF-2 subunit gamma [Acidilobaceae archaeon]